MEEPFPKQSVFASEDLWSILVGWTILLVALAATWAARPPDISERLARYAELTREADALAAEDGAAPEGAPTDSGQTVKSAAAAQLAALDKERQDAKEALAHNPLKKFTAKLSSWDNDPRDALVTSAGRSVAAGLLGVLIAGMLLFGVGAAAMGERIRTFPAAFTVVFLLAVLAFVMAGQTTIKHYNLEYALWALVVGLLISNTVGTPQWLRSATRTEFYIKTGLVLLGAEILFHRLLSLGLPGVFVAWVVTPVVLITTYVFGQRVLRIPSRSLNMVISADMSVCGVSAAIATAAACRAKREELSLAVGLSLSFTVIMMVVMPGVIKATGMSEVLGGAWIGGTIDSTGAVAAAGGMLGDAALAVASTVKMIQNMLIGAIAFGVAAYWVTRVERTPGASRPGLIEIWRRFPKFVLGFLAASIVFTLIATRGAEGDAITSAVIDGTTATLRGWFFCLAFVSIGLETNFRELSSYLAGGKPLVLYVCGQALNLLLTLLMAWLMFTKVFPDAAQALGN